MSRRIGEDFNAFAEFLSEYNLTSYTSVPQQVEAEDVQVGDIVTIWFNGMIKETYPAQLGVVYRIIKTQ